MATDRYEARCSRCGLIEVIDEGDAPGSMGVETFATFEAEAHTADCLGEVSVDETVGVDAPETTKYSVEGGIDESTYGVSEGER
jgi:hypothetical protein